MSCFAGNCKAYLSIREKDTCHLPPNVKYSFENQIEFFLSLDTLFTEDILYQANITVHCSFFLQIKCLFGAKTQQLPPHLETHSPQFKWLISLNHSDSEDVREESEEEMDSAGELSAPEDETDMMMELWINVCEEEVLWCCRCCVSQVIHSQRSFRAGWCHKIWLSDRTDPGPWR